MSEWNDSVEAPKLRRFEELIRGCAKIVRDQAPCELALNPTSAEMARLISVLREQVQERVQTLFASDLADIALLIALAIEGFLRFGDSVILENPEFFRFDEPDWYGGISFMHALVASRRQVSSPPIDIEGLISTPSGKLLIEWSQNKCNLWGSEPEPRSTFLQVAQPVR